jgi:pimeloyl-ACP methyl ester carboxylesterase
MVRGHVFDMPLDWGLQGQQGQGGEKRISVFVRELRKVKNANNLSLSSLEAMAVAVPAPTETLMYLQGGPGFPSPRPTAPPSGWMKSALDKGIRILLLDQRGTGNSSAVTPQSLDSMGRQGGLQMQMDFMTNMRADAIAADIDAIRIALCGETGKMSLLGQSYGGFCMLSYMSLYPAALGTCLFTCGLAPIEQSPRDVYTATFRRMLARNERYYSRYPEDDKKVKAIVLHIEQQPNRYVALPNGGRLTTRRFQQLGILLGSGAGMESMHWLMESAFFEPPTGKLTDTVPGSGAGAGGVLSEAFLQSVQDQQSCFETNPIYWLMHESIYINGGNGISGWVAESVILDAEFKDQFNTVLAAHSLHDTCHVNFTGEMVHSWMAEDYIRLGPFRDLAKALAEKQWANPLYDISVLRNIAKAIPCAGLVSYDDIYVERDFSECTARVLGGADACKLWVTNEFQHSGLRDDPARVFDMLYSMAQGGCSLPS